MSKLIHNKTELDKFNIGFEFEMFVSKKKLEAPQVEAEQIPENILQQYGHLFNVKDVEKNEYVDYKDAGQYFLNVLTEHYPEDNWATIFEYCDDGSLSDTDKLIGVEMVSKYMKGSEAMKLLVKVFSVLNLPEFKTTTDCGLHVNISFAKEAKNRKDLAYDIAKILDNAPILRAFNRSQNDFCVSNNKVQIDLDYVREDIAEKITDFILNTKLKNNEYIDMRSISQLNKKITEPQSLVHFCNLIEESVKDMLLEEWEDNRPAIAPKSQDYKNYIEFRSMGGKDYQKKYTQVENGINEFLIAMQKADIEHSNKSKKKSKTKMTA